MEEKIHVLNMLQQEMSVIRVAVDLKVTRLAIYNLIKTAAAALLNKVPGHKEGSGRDLLSSQASGAFQSLMMTSLTP